MISNPRLLAGPPLDGRAEPLAAHVARLGPVPARSARSVIEELDASGLRGRGGAGFPVGRKWRAIAERREGRSVVVANGAEGEPPSFKDRTLMVHRPHLVLEGAAIAADAIDADEIVLYIGGEHRAAIAAMRAALIERGAGFGRAARIVSAPPTYVAGEASAAVHWINDRDARPTTTPPRVSVQGVAGRPTLVQNVETLAHVALIARFGADWYRSVGRGPTRGTALVTISGPTGTPAVDEIELGTTVGELAARHGADLAGTRAVVFGGYFGTWSSAAAAWDLALDPAVLERRGLSFGCGMVGLLSHDVCGIAATASILGFMANESAGQCGPCLYGLRSISDAALRLAEGRPDDGDLARLERLAIQTRGRGACRHPDGAVQLLGSALEVFADEFRRHARDRECSVRPMAVAAR